MTDDASRLSRADAGLAVSGGTVDLTLNAEVHRICIAEGGYPAKWPRHLHCPCCGEGQLKSIFSKYQFNHDQCVGCGFVCLNPYPPKELLKKLYAGAYYSNFREYYEGHYLRQTGGHSMTAAPLELLEDMIARATAGRQTGEWLDVGGGIGTVADLVRRRLPGWAVTLNEFNPRSLELAQQIYGLDVVSNDADELLQMPRRFDVVSGVSVLEHVTEPLSFLTSYAALLKSDGIMAIIVPQFTLLNAAVSKAASPNATPPFHTSLFREDNLRMVLGGVGAFEMIETWQHGPPAFSLIHHYDVSEYWDVSIPTSEQPIPKGYMVKEYPLEVSAGLNALAQAEQVLGDHFGTLDGRLYLAAIGRKRSKGRVTDKCSCAHLHQTGPLRSDRSMSQVDEQNIAFWDELCGTSQARQLGVTDSSPRSLEKFDAWYFELYPYLFHHVRLEELVDRDVLEIGLGYGSLSQKIAESGARYVGLDIAAGPVEMVRHRLRQAGLPGRAEQGSVLAAPFPDECFDCVITIGCLHHTGDMGRGIAECRRMLRPGGSLLIMVYYAYSYRRWMQAPRQTLSYLWSEISGYRGAAAPNSERERWSYDHNSEGLAAPHTDFVSVKSLRYFCRDFSKFQWNLRNIDQEPPFNRHSREALLKTRWPDLCGLDIYANAIK